MRGKCRACSASDPNHSTVTNPLSPAEDASSAPFPYSALPVPGGIESTQDGDQPATGQTSTVAAPRRRAIPRPADPDGYELLGEIGHGGIGVVYLARELASCEPNDPSSGHRVAIKFLMDPNDYSQLERFRIEIKVLRELEDENVVRVLTANLDAAEPFFVMEIAGGGGLDKRVSVAAPMDPKLAAEWTKQVAEAVAKVHAKNILHRDLKPGNILLARRDREDAAHVRLKVDPRPLPPEPFSFADYYPKVADFGLAKRVGRGDAVTVGSAAMGSPPYMSPEQVKNPQSGDKDDRMSVRADVYSLGATLYHLLCGRPPYQGDPASVMLAVLRGDAPRLREVRPDVPPALEAIVAKAMEANPRHRYATAAALAADLGSYLKGEKTVAKKLTPVRRAWRAARRKKWALCGVGVGVALFALGAATGENKNNGVVAALPNLWVVFAEEIERQRELDAIYAELHEHGQAQLIGKSGNLRWHRWAVGKGTLTPAEARDGTIDFQAHGFVFLEVLPDPRLERYQVKFTLRHFHGELSSGSIGPYIGYGSDTSPQGRVVHATVAARYSDEYIWDELQNPAIAARHGVDLLHMLTVERPGRSIQNESEFNWNHLRFTPHEEEPRLWRELTFDVSPERIKLWWGLEGGKPEDAELVGRLAGPAVVKARASLPRDIVDQEPSPQLPPWQPRSPIGICSHGCVVSIKSVIVSATPAPK